MKQYGVIRSTINADESGLKVTKFCLVLAKLFFTEKELTPESINKKYWIDKVSLLSDLNNPQKIKSISNLIQTIGIKVLSNVNFNSNLNNLHAHTLICILDNEISEKNIKNIKNKSKFRNIIKVSLSKKKKDWLKDINGELIYLDLNCEKSKKNFLDKFEINPMKLF